MNTQIALTVELRLLAYAVFICIVMWLPYILTAIRTFGLVRMVSYPAVDYAFLPQWSQRLYRVHMNMVENLGPFAALRRCLDRRRQRNDRLGYPVVLLVADRSDRVVCGRHFLGPDPDLRHRLGRHDRHLPSDHLVGE